MTGAFQIPHSDDASKTHTRRHHGPKRLHTSHDYVVFFVLAIPSFANFTPRSPSQRLVCEHYLDLLVSLWVYGMWATVKGIPPGVDKMISITVYSQVFIWFAG
jgi:hypothetical protein